jgi:leucyl aminopeptidase
MDISVRQGSIESTETDTLIVNLFEGVASPGGATGAVDRAMGGAISNVIAGGDFRGKAGQVLTLYPRGDLPAQRVLVAGLGDPRDFDLEGVRLAAAAAIKKTQQLGSWRGHRKVAC